MNARMYKTNLKLSSDVSQAATGSTKSQSMPTSDFDSDPQLNDTHTKIARNITVKNDAAHVMIGHDSGRAPSSTL